MKALVVFESMFGNTRRVAESVAEGLAEVGEVRTACVADGPPDLGEDLDLVVVGGPTHAWSMSRPATRKGAPNYVNKPGSGLNLEPGADTSQGVREWLKALDGLTISAAAFDTRINKSAILTGRASKAIARALTRRGAHLVVPPESFVVDSKSHLLVGETGRARSWGRHVAAKTDHWVTQSG